MRTRIEQRQEQLSHHHNTGLRSNYEGSAHDNQGVGSPNNILSEPLFGHDISHIHIYDNTRTTKPINPVSNPTLQREPQPEEKNDNLRDIRDLTSQVSDVGGLGNSMVQGLGDTAARQVFGPGMAAEGSAFTEATGRFGGAFGALSLITGTATALDSKADTSERVMGGLSATSGGMGFLGSLFPSLAAGGSTGLAATATGEGALGAAGAWGGAGAAAGSAGALLGAGLAGVTIGKLLDKGADWVGDQISGDEKADHSLSHYAGKGLYAADAAIHGANNDPLQNPNENYRNTWGWKLAEWLD